MKFVSSDRKYRATNLILVSYLSIRESIHSRLIRMWRKLLFPLEEEVKSGKVARRVLFTVTNENAMPLAAEETNLKRYAWARPLPRICDNKV